MIVYVYTCIYIKVDQDNYAVGNFGKRNFRRVDYSHVGIFA